MTTEARTLTSLTNNLKQSQLCLSFYDVFSRVVIILGVTLSTWSIFCCKSTGNSYPAESLSVPSRQKGFESCLTGSRNHPFQANVRPLYLFIYLGNSRWLLIVTQLMISMSFRAASWPVLRRGSVQLALLCWWRSCIWPYWIASIFPQQQPLTGGSADAVSINSVESSDPSWLELFCPASWGELERKGWRSSCAFL